MQAVKSSDIIEQLAKGLQKLDITKNYSLEHKIKVPAEMQFVMDKINFFFGQYWNSNLKKMGIKESMKNYSDMFSVNLLKNADLSIFEDGVTEFYEEIINSDDEEPILTEDEENQIVDLFKDFNLVKLYDLMFPNCDNELYSMLLKPIFVVLQRRVDDEFVKESKILGKSKKKMTEEERLAVWQKSIDSSAQNVINNLMRAQRVPEIFGISKTFGSAEDFSNRKENHSKIDFLRKQYGLRRKFDCTLSYDELQENDLIGLSPEIEVEGITDEEIDTAVAGFLDTLDDVEKTIYFMKQDGHTQEEIAEALGYKTHSAVTKRLTKMKEKAMKYCDSIGI